MKEENIIYYIVYAIGFILSSVCLNISYYNYGTGALLCAIGVGMGTMISTVAICILREED